MNLLESFAHAEGFYDERHPNSVPRRTNNPGDLRYDPKSVAFKLAVGNDHGYMVFPDLATGWKALRMTLAVPAKFVPDTEAGRKSIAYMKLPPERNGPRGWLLGGYLGATLRQVIYRYCPPEDRDNNPEAYVADICRRAGYTPDTVLTLEMLVIPELAGSAS